MEKLEDNNISVDTKAARINRQIAAREVRLIDEAGEQLGILNIDKALERARESGLDLVEVSPNAEVPEKEPLL